MKELFQLKPVAFLLHIFILVGPCAFSQMDSTANSAQDSLLDQKNKQKTELLVQADSFHLADSLEQAAILLEISQLRAKDQKQKKKLQSQLDSIRLNHEANLLRVKRQVDSLKANTVGMPVILYKDTLFNIYSKLGPFTPTDRAVYIANRLVKLVSDRIYSPDLLKIKQGEESSDIIHGDVIVLSVTDRDAFWLNKPKEEVAGLYVDRIKNSIAEYKKRTGLFETSKRIGFLILVLTFFIFGVRFLSKYINTLNEKITNYSKRFIKGIKFKNYEFLSVEQEIKILGYTLNILKWVVILVIIYVALPILFSIFPATKGIATTLIGYILNPLISFGKAFIGYIPEAITIIVIILVTHYFVRFLKFLSSEIESGKLELPGFYADWAAPTFNLVKIIIYAFSFIIVFPYLPGSDSPVFQGVSVFFGLLISMGSSSAIGNIIAGLVLTYMRAFKIGDRVKIGDTTGDVLEKTLLVTRLKTIKNEEITIPNSSILNGSTTNYSASAKSPGLILNTTITIGYDVPWPKVHELLIAAALKAEHIQAEPQPFILQTSLDDFYVSYQLNAYTQNAKSAAKIYSQIHANIQDAFNNAGLEILSPHYRAARDGNMMAVPAEFLPPNYSSPKFQVKIEKD